MHMGWCGCPCHIQTHMQKPVVYPGGHEDYEVVQLYLSPVQNRRSSQFFAGKDEDQVCVWRKCDFVFTKCDFDFTMYTRDNA